MESEIMELSNVLIDKLKTDGNEFFDFMIESEFNSFYLYSLIIFWMDEGNDEYLIRYLMHFKDDNSAVNDIWNIISSENDNRNKIESVLELNI